MPARSKISTFSKEVIYPETELSQIIDMTEFMRNANTKKNATEIKEILGLADGAIIKSPILEGIPIAPTAPLGTNTNQIATTAFVIGMLSGLMESVPEALNTLEKIAAALGNDPNFSTTIMNLIEQKLSLSGGTVTGKLNAKGGIEGDLEGTASNASKVNNLTVETAVPKNAVFTDTHYKSSLVVGNSEKSTANTAASNGSVHLNELDDSTVRSSHIIKGSGATSVTSNENGTITINSTDTTYSEFVKSGIGAKAGLVPTPGTTAGNKRFLREDGTWHEPTNTDTTYSEFVRSGPNAKAGLVPAPGGTAGTTKYLREDGTWQAPCTAASAAPKAHGAATVGTSTKYAREDHVHPLQTSVTGSSGSCTGNAATATKATYDKNGLQIDTSYMKLAGGTMTGNTTMRVTQLANKSTLPTASQGRYIQFCTNDGNAAANRIGMLYGYADKNGVTGMQMLAYKYAGGDSSKGGIGVYNNAGEVYTAAPTPASNDSSTKIATTKYVNNRLLRTDMAINIPTKDVGGNIWIN